MTTMASQITSLTVVYLTVYSDADQRKHQSSASLAFVWGIHWDRWIPHTKGQLRGKCFHLMTSSCHRGFCVTQFLCNFHWYGNDTHISIPQNSNISRTLGNKIVDQSDVVGASPDGTAPITSAFSTKHMAPMDWAKQLQDETRSI